MDAERTERIILEILKSGQPPTIQLESIKEVLESYRQWAERRYW